MLPHQRFSNQLFVWLLGLRIGLTTTDLGPYRVIRRDAQILELPLTYRPRLDGQSKVGGTLCGLILTAHCFHRAMLRYAI